MPAITRGLVFRDSPIGNCRVIFIAHDRNIESGLETRLVKARKHHAGISTFKLGNGVLTTRSFAEIETTQSFRQLAGEFQMNLCRTGRNRLLQRKPHHFLRLVIGDRSFGSGSASLDLSFSDVEIKRVENDLLCRRAHTQVDRCFAGERLHCDDRIEVQRVVTRDNGLRKTLGE